MSILWIGLPPVSSIVKEQDSGKTYKIYRHTGTDLMSASPYPLSISHFHVLQPGFPSTCIQIVVSSVTLEETQTKTHIIQDCVFTGIFLDSIMFLN